MQNQMIPIRKAALSIQHSAFSTHQSAKSGDPLVPQDYMKPGFKCAVLLAVLILLATATIGSPQSAKTDSRSLLRRDDNFHIQSRSAEVEGIKLRASRFH